MTPTMQVTASSPLLRDKAGPSLPLYDLIGDMFQAGLSVLVRCWSDFQLRLNIKLYGDELYFDRDRSSTVLQLRCFPSISIDLHNS